MTEQTDTNIMFIVERPMYRVIVIVDGTDIDVNIVLTAKGKRYAGARARGFHHFMRDDEDALAEIIHARDNYYPAAQRPDRTFEALNFTTE
jgi:hypothetical protein